MELRNGLLTGKERDRYQTKFGQHVEQRKLRRQTNLNWKLIITYVRKN